MAISYQFDTLYSMQKSAYKGARGISLDPTLLEIHIRVAHNEVFLERLTSLGGLIFHLGYN